jgi:hypothetical protein
MAFDYNYYYNQNLDQKIKKLHILQKYNRVKKIEY